MSITANVWEVLPVPNSISIGFYEQITDDSNGRIVVSRSVFENFLKKEGYINYIPDYHKEENYTHPFYEDEKSAKEAAELFLARYPDRL